MTTRPSQIDALEQIGTGAAFHDRLCTMIESVQLFDNIARNEISILANHMQAYRARKGTQVISEGGRDGYMCILTRGRVAIYKEDGESQPKRITEVRSGHPIGEMSLLDNYPHSASAIATEESELVMLTRDNFNTICRKHPQLGVTLLQRIARLLSLRLRQTSGMLVGYMETEAK